MSEAYRIKRFHHVTDAKQKRLRSEKLIPLIAHFSGSQIMSEDIDTLMTSEEAMTLKMDEIDALEEQLLITKNLLKGDWLIEYTNNEKPVHIMKFHQYSFEQHKHLYIKHFAMVSHVFSVKPSVIPDEVQIQIEKSSHLQTLPLEVSHMLDKYEALAKAKEEIKKELDKQKAERKTESKNVRRTRKQRDNSHNGPVIVKSIANADSLRAIAIYKERYPGKQPTRSQIESIRKEITKKDSGKQI